MGDEVEAMRGGERVVSAAAGLEERRRRRRPRFERAVRRVGGLPDPDGGFAVSAGDALWYCCLWLSGEDGVARFLIFRVFFLFGLLQTPFETPIQTPLPGSVDQLLYHMPTPAGLGDYDDPINADIKPGKPSSYMVSSVKCSSSSCANQGSLGLMSMRDCGSGYILCACICKIEFF